MSAQVFWEGVYKSVDVMRECFTDHLEAADIEAALATTLTVADKVEGYDFFGDTRIPDFPVPVCGSSGEEEDGAYVDGDHVSYLRHVARLGMDVRLEKMLSSGLLVSTNNRAEIEKVYEDRLQFELDMIKQMGFSSYFLVVWDYILYARNVGIPVDPGRGSAAGSLFAFALRITNVDPGLKNLTVIETALGFINTKQQRFREKARIDAGLAVGVDTGLYPDRDLSVDVPLLDDPSKYELLSTSELDGMFQLDASTGMRSIVRELRPSSLEDISAILALYRPGPLDEGLIPKFINRKHGREAIKYDHELLEPILCDTYGVMVYLQRQSSVRIPLTSTKRLEEARRSS